MEIGAVIAAAPAENVRRACPMPVMRSSCLAGAPEGTASAVRQVLSKAHTAHSVETCGAEVQKGNAPEERAAGKLPGSKTEQAA